MTLAELATAVAEVGGMSDGDSLAIIKRSISRRYRMVWDAHLWRDSLVLASTAAAGHEVIAPAGIERVTALRWDSAMLYPIDQQTLMQFDAEIFERTGTPQVFSHLTPVGVHTLPATAEPIRLVSSSASDAATNVLLRGESAGGVEIVEALTLNGTTPVTSTQSFAVVTLLAKQPTTGIVTVTGATSSTALQTLWPEETERKHPRIRLHERPSDTSKSLLICGKRRFRAMTNDLDSPLLRGLDNALIAYGRADEWKRQRQYGKSSAEAAEGAAQIAIAIDGEKSQGAAIARIVPQDFHDEIF